MRAKGVRFLIPLLARKLLVPLSVYGILANSTYHVSGLVSLCTCLLVAILEAITLSYLGKVSEMREMARLGAQPVPQVPAKLPGGLDIMNAITAEEKSGYLAYHVTKWAESINTTYAVTVLGDSMIVTIEPECIKRVLATEFHNYEKGERFCSAMESVLGVGIFNSDGEMWKFHRSMTRPFFSRERVSDFEAFEKHANEALTVLLNRLKEGEAVDFQDLASRFTLDTATSFLFGSCVGSLAAPLPFPPNSASYTSTPSSVPADVFARAFTNAQFSVAHRDRVGWFWHFEELFKDRTADDMKFILSFIDPIIDAALSKKRKDVGDSGAEGNSYTIDEDTHVEEGETLLDHLVKCTEDRVIIRDEILNMMVAGRDTTASALTFSTYMLATHPHVFSKLREEILAQVGPTRPPNYEDIKQMKYLRAVLNETLRLFSPVPYDVRTSKVSSTFPSSKPGGKPYYIPAGVKIAYSALVMHRDKNLWGSDAWDFDPERFIDERLHKYLVPNPYIFLPFNAGPRICLGQQFAYNELSFFLVRLLQSFRTIELAKDAQPADTLPPAKWKELDGRAPREEYMLQSHLTMSIKGGLWVRMTATTDSE